jgi:hypothetical protein
MADTRKRPWHMFYPLLLVVGLGVAWSIYWGFVFTQTKKLVAETRAELGAQGATLSCASESWGGFPFRIEFTCAKAALAAKNSAQAFSLQSENIAAVMMAYNFSHVLVFVDGPTVVNGVTASHGRALISLRAGKAEGDFDASSEIPKLSVANQFNAGMLKLFSRRVGGKLNVAANAASLSVMAPNQRKIELDAAEFVAETPAKILESKDPVQEAAQTGQAVDITSFRLSKGDASIQAKGALHLEPNRVPAGKITTETEDIDKLLTALAPTLGLSEPNQAAIASMLAILAKDPTSKRRSADIVATKGELYWGPFKLGDLKPVE